MGNYFCPFCAVECDEPICSYCNKPAESLKIDSDSNLSDEKYSPEDLVSVEDLAEEEGIDDLDNELKTLNEDN